jgi:katanin p80 WD40 repeat-containing subunit B1
MYTYGLYLLGVKICHREDCAINTVNVMCSSDFRCIYFSQGGECLYAGSQDVLKMYGWEPARTYDTIHVGWGKIQDIATAQNQLIGASFHLTNVVLYVVDLKRVQPFGGEPDGPKPSPFTRGQSIRKSFSREKPLTVTKAT